MSKMDSVVPTRLDLGSEFKFRCHKDIECFTKCCSNIDILLTPYDVLRLKNRLGLSSSEFLMKYTYTKEDEQSSHPYAMLKMENDKDRRCQFVTDEGCKVYTDRPANCRYYPIGQGTIKKEGKDGPYEDEFYFIVSEPHCLGFKETKKWTIESWRVDQEMDVYDEMNREWKALQLRKNQPGKPGLDDRKKTQFYLASYDLDEFKRYIFESKFLDVFDIDSETIGKIRESEIELMKFGFKYIKYIMMLEQTLKVKNEVLEAGIKKDTEKTQS